MKHRKPPRSWWTEHFLDHPRFTNKNPDAYISSGTVGTTVTKVYCKLCFPGQGPGGFTHYASKTQPNHLKYCPHQSFDVRQRAQAGAESPKDHGDPHTRLHRWGLHRSLGRFHWVRCCPRCSPPLNSFRFTCPQSQLDAGFSLHFRTIHIHHPCSLPCHCW